jgi:carbonic anhydrase/acetyltransferase-like protein (isoleucine patch superfamily)
MPSNSWITPYGDKIPRIHPDVFVDVSVRIIGDVYVEEGASIWPMTVVRADDEEVHVGARAAVLDQSLLEAPEGQPVWLEEEALVSHGVIIHGARIQSHALVGIGAIVLDGALVSSGSIIGAGSIVTPHAIIPPNSLVLGVPGKIVRETTPEERQSIVRQVQGLYQKSRQLISAT